MVLSLGRNWSTPFHGKLVEHNLKIGCGHFEVDHEMMEYSQACASNWKKIPFEMIQELFPLKNV